MPNYRIYEVSKDGHIGAPPHVVTCDTDQEAIRRARQLVNGHHVELWEGPRLVTRIASPD